MAGTGGGRGLRTPVAFANCTHPTAPIVTRCAAGAVRRRGFCAITPTRDGAQTVVKSVTQERAIWALPPSFRLWQLDRTEGPSRIRARLTRPEREQPFVVPRLAGDGSHAGMFVEHKRGGSVPIAPVLDPLTAGILRLALEEEDSCEAAVDALAAASYEDLQVGLRPAASQGRPTCGADGLP